MSWDITPIAWVSISATTYVSYKMTAASLPAFKSHSGSFLVVLANLKHSGKGIPGNIISQLTDCKVTILFHLLSVRNKNDHPLSLLPSLTSSVIPLFPGPSESFFFIIVQDHLFLSLCSFNTFFTNLTDCLSKYSKDNFVCRGMY